MKEKLRRERLKKRMKLKSGKKFLIIGSRIENLKQRIEKRKESNYKI